MGFLFGTEKKEKLIAIFDIGSGSVGSALVNVFPNINRTPTIIKSVRSDIKYRDELDFNVFLEDMLISLNMSANLLYNSKLGMPSEVICVLASPWYLTETRLIKMSHENPFVFNKKLASELFEKEISSFKEAYDKKYQNVENNLEVIEHHIVGVALNGYLVENPIGVKSSSLEMNIILSLSPKVCIDKIKQTIIKTFHHIPISFSSFMVSAFLAVRDKYLVPDSYLLLDVGGEVTDVGIVYRGILKESLSFPFGKRTFFKYICSKLDIELRDAEELFKLLQSDTISESKREKISPIFKSVENLWSESFRKCISNLPRTLSLPNTIFLTADADIRDWFADIIRNEEYIQSMVIGNKCKVVTLEGKEFIDICGTQDKICDPFLMIEAIAQMRKIEK